MVSNRPLFLRCAVYRVVVVRLYDGGSTSGDSRSVTGMVAAGNDCSTCGRCLDEGVVAGAPGATRRRRGHCIQSCDDEDGGRRKEEAISAV